VLELGAGEGRDSVFLAAHGFAVTAVEVSGDGLAKARRLARRHGVQVRWVQDDMARCRVDGPFDLVYSCGAIHYVPGPERARLFPRLRSLTAPGGYHAHVVFTDEHVYVELGERMDYFGPGELLAAYRGWQILEQGRELISCAADGRRHRHSVERLVARTRATARASAG
jgi:tellurite methyltransferase